jgi:hypothetical protein
LAPHFSIFSLTKIIEAVYFLDVPGDENACLKINRAVKLCSMSRAGWITVKEFASRVGLAPSSIRNLLRNGKIKRAKLETTPIGDAWFLPESLVETFEARGRGRPPKTAKKALGGKAKRKT